MIRKIKETAEEIVGNAFLLALGGLILVVFGFFWMLGEGLTFYEYLFGPLQPRNRHFG